MTTRREKKKKKRKETENGKLNPFKIRKKRTRKKTN